MRSFFKNLWEKAKPYIAYIMTFLGAVIGFLLLGRKSATKASDELTRQQDIRNEKTDEIINKTEHILSDADQKIEDYYTNKQNRGL